MKYKNSRIVWFENYKHRIDASKLEMEIIEKDLLATKQEDKWVGKFAPNCGHDPNNPFPLKKEDNPVKGVLKEKHSTGKQEDKKDVERNGWFNCNRCGTKFHVDHEITESGALCNSCFSNLIDKTHPTPSPIEFEEIPSFGLNANNSQFENNNIMANYINILIREVNKLKNQIK